MARPGRSARNRAARSFRQLMRFHHVINSDKVFGTHNGVSAWDGGQNSTWLSSSGILTKDPIANRTPMASQAVAGLFQYWSPAAQTRISVLPRVKQGPPLANAGRPDSFKPRHLQPDSIQNPDSPATFLSPPRGAHSASPTCYPTDRSDRAMRRRSSTAEFRAPELVSRNSGH